MLFWFHKNVSEDNKEQALTPAFQSGLLTESSHRQQRRLRRGHDPD